MSDPNHIEVLCTSGDLYSEDFIKTFGEIDAHWKSNTWFQREASLRHDMVCVLLCNLEVDESRDALDLNVELNPKPLKRRRIGEASTSSSSSGRSDRGVIDQDVDPDGEILAAFRGDENIYRYILLEGKSNLAQIQNKISSILQIDNMKRQYDIYDKEEKKFIEVKVTLDYGRSEEEYLGYLDDRRYTALVHINPSTLQHVALDKQDEMPGLSKAIEFLAKRKSLLLGRLNFMESDLYSVKDLSSTIFCNDRFNRCVEEWTKLFWDHRKKPLGSQENFAKTKTLGHILEPELKMLIEDTSKRNADFMQFPGKVLPDPMVSHIETDLDKDAEMVDLLFQDLIVPPTQPKAEIVNWVISKWKAGNRNTFSLTTVKERAGTLPNFLRDLGIGCKGTIRNDDHKDLKQKEFKPPEKKRYSAWMSHLLKELAEPNDLELNCFVELQQREHEDDHPMSQITASVADKYFKLFGMTNVASYCSKLKGVYSRLGGAYLGRDRKSKDRPDSVVFPIYSVGEKEGQKSRALSGFIIRGPQHTRAATDKIPYISVELLNCKQGLKYRNFIRGAHIFYDTLGRAWCYRVNSIMKGATSYVSFVINSAFLPANMLGEITLGNPLNKTDFRADEEMAVYLRDHGLWLMERCAESVMMAATGSSQEEGAMAIIRKIFMLKLNWHRGKLAIGCDTPGLAEALNETLIDSPFALYMGQQIRSILLG